MLPYVRGKDVVLIGHGHDPNLPRRTRTHSRMNLHASEFHKTRTAEQLAVLIQSKTETETETKGPWWRVGVYHNILPPNP